MYWQNVQWLSYLIPFWFETDGLGSDVQVVSIDRTLGKVEISQSFLAKKNEVPRRKKKVNSFTFPGISGPYLFSLISFFDCLSQNGYPHWWECRSANCDTARRSFRMISAWYHVAFVRFVFNFENFFIPSWCGLAVEDKAALFFVHLAIDQVG